MNQKEFNEVFSGLTDRRREVLQKVLNRETNDASAKSLTITPATVRKHIEEICDLFGIPRGTSGKRYPRRNDLIALFARYKPELLHWDTPEVPRPPKVKVEETTSNNSDSVAVESAIADSASEDIEVLVQKVRSHFDKTIQNECETLCTFNLLYTPMQGNLSRIYVQTKLNESQGFGSAEFSQERKLWNEIVLRNPNLMVLGKPGAGKTTLLQYIAVHCDQIPFQYKPVPVFVSLKFLAEDEIDLLGYIRKKYCRSNVSEQQLEILLSDGRLLFLLDGLDEVTEDKIRAVIQVIHNLVEEYDKNRFIVSCRKEFQAYKSKAFGSFIPCQVSDFEQKQIENFITNWFAEATLDIQTERTRQANQLIEKLRLRENQRIRELADTPLLLHLICLIFQERGDFPSKRVNLYKEGIDLLLEKWNQFNERIQVDVVELRNALRRIASLTFEEGKSSFEEGEILPFIENCSRTLSDIEVLSGLLVKKTWKTYAFSHQTFQEYLIAEELVISQQGWRKLLTHITEPRWREVFLLAIESLPNTDNFLRLFQQGFHKLVAESPSDWWYKWYEELENNLDISSPEVSSSEYNYDGDCLEAFIIEINPQLGTLHESYKASAIRAFYFFSCNIIMTWLRSNTGEYLGWSSFGFANEDIFELICAIDNNFCYLADADFSIKNEVEFDYFLVFAFEIASQLSYACVYGDIETSEIYKLNYDLERNFSSIIYFIVNHKYEILDSLQQLKNKLPSINEELETIVEWWVNEGAEWVEYLRDWMVEHRNIGHKEWITCEDLEVLQRYYDANKLLVGCLNSNKVSSEVRSRIEDNLFMPLDSSLD